MVAGALALYKATLLAKQSARRLSLNQAPRLLANADQGRDPAMTSVKC